MATSDYERLEGLLAPRARVEKPKDPDGEKIVPRISNMVQGFAKRFKNVFRRGPEAPKSQPVAKPTAGAAPAATQERDLSKVNSLQDLSEEETRDWDSVSAVLDEYGADTQTRLDAGVIPVGISAFFYPNKGIRNQQQSESDLEQRVGEVMKALATQGYVGVSDNDNLIPDDAAGKAYSLAKNGDFYQFRIGIIPDEVQKKKLPAYEGTQAYDNELTLRHELQERMAEYAGNDPSAFVINTVPSSEKISISVAREGLDEFKNVMNEFGIPEYTGQEEINRRRDLCYQVIPGENHDYVEIANLPNSRDIRSVQRMAA